MQRLRLWDFRTSRLPTVLGLCADDIPRLGAAVNTAQRRLLYARESGEEGWWGTWAEMLFSATTTNPYITLPRDVARLEMISVCSVPTPVHNQFFEYLSFGNGTMPGSCGCGDLLQSYSRNNVVTWSDIEAGMQVAIYKTNAADVGKRVLIQGTDTNDTKVYSQDVFSRVEGVFVTMANPYALTPLAFNTLTGIQKDVTSGEVHFYEFNPNNGEQRLLLTMEPSETTASYRRYYLHPLPTNCCGENGTITVKAMAKRELIPVGVDTDYTLLQNMEAIIEEAASARYSTIDTMEAKRMAAERHAQAIALLNGELNHYVGKNSAAISFKPFGSATLARRRIGSLV